MRRRRLLAAALASLCVGLATVVAGPADAQSSYPSRSVRLIVGFGAGGATDIVARVLGNKLAESLGQSFVIENRTGGSGTIATEAVARAEPDGHTLLLVPLANAVNETLFKTLKARGGEQLVAVAPVADTSNVLIVHPSLPVKTLGEFIAYARAQPAGGLVGASSGRGTAPHLALELFNTMAGTKIRPVHYRGGGDTIRDLVTGEVKLMFATTAPIIEYIRNGSVRAIATTSVNRDPLLPELPTVIEAGLPGFDVRLWIGLMTPAGTPAAIIDRLSAETVRALKDPELRKAFATQGFEPMPGTPQQFDTFYKNEVAKWRKVIEINGISND